MLLLKYTPPAQRPGEHYMPGQSNTPAHPVLPVVRRRFHAWAFSFYYQLARNGAGKMGVRVILATSQRSAKTLIRRETLEEEPDAYGFKFTSLELGARELSSMLAKVTGGQA